MADRADLEVMADIPGTWKPHHPGGIADCFVAAADADQPLHQRLPTFTADWDLQDPITVNALATGEHHEGRLGQPELLCLHHLFGDGNVIPLSEQGKAFGDGLRAVTSIIHHGVDAIARSLESSEGFEGAPLITLLSKVAFEDRFALVAGDGAVANTASQVIAAKIFTPPESLINEERNVLLPDLLTFVHGVPPNLNRDGRCVGPYPLPDMQGLT